MRLETENMTNTILSAPILVGMPVYVGRMPLQPRTVYSEPNQGVCRCVRETIAKSLQIYSLERVVEKASLKDLQKDTWRYELFIPGESRMEKTIRIHTTDVVVKMRHAILSLGELDDAIRFEYCVTLKDYNQYDDSIRWCIQMNKYGHIDSDAPYHDEVMLE